MKDVDDIYISDGIQLRFNGRANFKKDTYQNVVIHKKLGNEFSWEYDEASNTIIFSGKGNLPADFQFQNSYSFAKMVISDGITGFTGVGDYNGWNVGTIKFGKDVKAVPLGMRRATTAYEVDSSNPYIAAYDQCLYTKKYGTFFHCPDDKTSIKFPENVDTIAEWAFAGSSIKQLIIPWGVRTIEQSAFSALRNSPTIILPDTLQNVSSDIAWMAKGVTGEIIYSKNNTAVINAIAAGIKAGQSEWSVVTVKVDSVHSYYDLDPVKPTPPTEKPASEAWMKQNGKWYYYRDGSMVKGWLVEDKATKKTKNLGLSDAMTPAAQSKTYLLDPKTGAMVTGLYRSTATNKAYFFDSSGLMQHSKWQYASGNWYYLNAYGAGAVKHWAKSGGKWFYLKEDGKMATNQWIEWYKKWYYVGSDGVMYTNRRTPDGRYVNASGVWVR